MTKSRLLFFSIGFIFLIIGACNQSSNSGNSNPLILTNGSPESVGMSTERLNRIDRVVDEYVNMNRISCFTNIAATTGKYALHKRFAMRVILKGGKAR